MSSPKSSLPPPDPVVFVGTYITRSNVRIKFSTSRTGPDTVVIFLGGRSEGINTAFPDGRGVMLHVTNDSFDNLIKNVVNKNIQWSATRSVDNTEVMVPGTWELDNQFGDDIADYDAHVNGTYPNGANPYLLKREGGRAGRKGYGSTRKHNRRPTRRKPTKRRGSRRGNRKTKKN